MIRECLQPLLPDCSLDQKGRSRRSNEHHLYFPKNKYTTPLENAFRELEQNKIQICICAHDALHEYTFPPQKPSVIEMVMALSVQFEDDDNPVMVERNTTANHN